MCICESNGRVLIIFSVILQTVRLTEAALLFAPGGASWCLHAKSTSRAVSTSTQPEVIANSHPPTVYVRVVNDAVRLSGQVR